MRALPFLSLLLLLLLLLPPQAGAAEVRSSGAQDPARALAKVPPGVTSIGRNAQGYEEYRHEKTGIVLVLLPGGKFIMGSPPSEEGRSDDEGPVHEVTLSPFLIGKLEVTQAEWERAMGTNPSFYRGADRPVTGVSWEACQEFCARTGLKLPTEAQWEYACRAGTTGPYAGTGRLDDVGWYNRNSYKGGKPVGQKQPNGFGLHDMHGNVQEWCEDVYDQNWYWKPAASGPDPVCLWGSRARVYRGGDRSSHAWSCRSASRCWDVPSSGLSLRAALPLAQPPEEPLRQPPRESAPAVGSSEAPDQRPAARTLDGVPAGFAAIGKNAQGCEEYRHEKTGIVLVLLPGGKFSMGSPPSESEPDSDEAPVHEVTLSPFLIAKHEVTQAEWERVMGTRPSEFEGDDRPVENVSWQDCQQFCARTGLKLPTEAQWEYACRAGTTGPYAGTGRLDDVGWYNRNSYKGGEPVGQKQPNGFGLHDMHGNVQEWCEDVYDQNWYTNPGASGRDPVCASLSWRRVIRGGSWLSDTSGVRSAVRRGEAPSNRYFSLGFRPAGSLP